DDLTRALVGNEIKSDALAEGILIREEPARHRLVDDDDERTRSNVLSCDIPAAQDRNLHRREVIRRDGKIIGCLSLLRASSRCGAGRRSRTSFDQKLHLDA